MQKKKRVIVSPKKLGIRSRASKGNPARVEAKGCCENLARTQGLQLNPEKNPADADFDPSMGISKTLTVQLQKSRDGIQEKKRSAQCDYSSLLTMPKVSIAPIVSVL